MTLDDLQNDMNINFFGAFNTFKHVLSKLKKDNGASAIFFSTVAAQTGMTFHSSIAAAKGALESFAKASAAELAPRLAINVIAPSITKTPMASNLLSDDKKIDASADRHPLKEIGSPEQVATCSGLPISFKGCLSAEASIFLSSESKLDAMGVLVIEGAITLIANLGANSAADAFAKDSRAPFAAAIDE